jgi:hypothetical protein
VGFARTFSFEVFVAIFHDPQAGVVLEQGSPGCYQTEGPTSDLFVGGLPVHEGCE